MWINSVKLLMVKYILISEMLNCENYGHFNQWNSHFTTAGLVRAFTTPSCTRNLQEAVTEHSRPRGPGAWTLPVRVLAALGRTFHKSHTGTHLSEQRDGLCVLPSIVCDCVSQLSFANSGEHRAVTFDKNWQADAPCHLWPVNPTPRNRKSEGWALRPELRVGNHNATSAWVKSSPQLCM